MEKISRFDATIGLGKHSFGRSNQSPKKSFKGINGWKSLPGPFLLPAVPGWDWFFNIVLEVTICRNGAPGRFLQHIFQYPLGPLGPCLKHTAKVKNGDTKRERWANIDDEAESLGWQVLSFTGRKNRAICTTFPGTKCLFVFLTKMIFFKYV